MNGFGLLTVKADDRCSGFINTKHIPLEHIYFTLGRGYDTNKKKSVVLWTKQ